MYKEKEVKSVLNKTKKRDEWFLDDYTYNPYSSCSFNCLYCYIRGSQYGENLATSLTVKSNALELLDAQLSRRAQKGEVGIIVLSSATDPYLKVEEELKITRESLKIILKHRFPVHIITKSNLVERDFDILHEIDQRALRPKGLESFRRGSIISFSFSTLDDQVAKIFEPGATPPSQRINTLEQSIKNGFLSGVSLMPLIPFISDTAENLESTFDTFSQLGADYVLPATLTLFGNDKPHSKTLVIKAIEKHYPHLLPKYHKYFDHNHQLPLYYRKAFQQKMIELKEKFQIENSILHAGLQKDF